MQKITEEELKKIEVIKQQTLEVASALGELNYQKIIIDQQIDLQKEKVYRLKNEEALLFQELREKYGNVSINIESGEYS